MNYYMAFNLNLIMFSFLSNLHPSFKFVMNLGGGQVYSSSTVISNDVLEQTRLEVLTDYDRAIVEEEVLQTA